MDESDIARAELILHRAPQDVRDEGLACLRNAQPGFLIEIIPMDSQLRVAAVFFIENNN